MKAGCDGAVSSTSASRLGVTMANIDNALNNSVPAASSQPPPSAL